MISVPGVGSGLDINSIVESLVSAESDAKTRLLANRRSGISSEVSAFGSLKSIVETLRTSAAKLANPATFTAFSASSQDTSYFTVEATVQASAGVYDVEVRGLAEQHKLLSPGYSDANTDVGFGIMTISVGSDSFDVEIDSENQTLNDIRNAINDAQDNTGVSATLLTVDDGTGGTLTKLVLTSNETGADNAITVTVADDDGNNTDGSGLSAFYYDTADATTPEHMTEINEALDAELYIDSQKVLSASNTVTDVLDGVTLNLAKAETGVINKLTISPNINSAKTAVESFVTSYNAFINQVNSLTAYNAETGVGGVLLGDATLRTLSNSVRIGVSSSLPGLSNEFRNIVELGITSTANGTLQIDQAKLTEALNSNSVDVATLFSADNGIATGLSNKLNEYVRTDGIFENKTESLNDSIEDIDDDLEALSLRMEALESRLFAQFAALDQLMSQLNSTSSFLTQQFDQISQITQSRSRR